MVYAFNSCFYPLLGLLGLWGKYKTMFVVGYLLFGSLSLAIDESRHGLMIDLSLIAIGAGGIKISVMWDQFCKATVTFLKVYGWFIYRSI